MNACESTTAHDPSGVEIYDPDDVFGHYSPALQPVRPRLRDSPVPWESQVDLDGDDELDLNSPWYSLMRTKVEKHPWLDDDEQNTNSSSRRKLSKEDPPILDTTGMRISATERDISELPLSNSRDNGRRLDRGTMHRPGGAIPPVSLDPRLSSLFRPVSPQDSRSSLTLRSNDNKWEGPADDYSDVSTPSSTTAQASTPSTPDFNGQFQPRKLRKTGTRKRFTLPIVIEGATGPSHALAFPDTGSDNNIISLDMVHDAGLEMADIGKESAKFSIANGKVVEAIGQVTVRFAFAKGSSSDSPVLDCLFYVFSKLAVPIIVGMAFLDETETFSRHRNRLVEEIVPSMQALRVSSIGRPKNNLVCQMDNYVGCASADTGSDLDLVCPEFAISRGFRIEPGFEKLEFADGSYGITCGVFQATFAVGNQDQVRGFIQRGEPVERDFYILESLTSDILVGIDTLEEMNIFSHHSESFIPSIPRLGLSDANIIRYVGTVERLAKDTWRAFKDGFSRTAKNDTSDLQGLRELQQDIILADQRENARRESQRDRIAALARAAREIAQAEEDGRIQDYEKERQCRLQDGLVSPSVSVFACTFPGCAAPPFQTQYLLNSHLNVHSPVRPFYCAVRGCPRSEGGKGFKRRNEMIRHGLVHDSPGYVCPFCPDQEHNMKYPRQDNLMRHVRVHHAYKDKDDPALREALSRGPVGADSDRQDRSRGLRVRRYQRYLDNRLIYIGISPE